MKIAIASDHGGFNLKNDIVKFLQEKGHEVVDFGVNSSESVDYPDYALKVCESITNNECERGILVCGTGIGMSIMANKVQGIRCALVHDVFSAKATRAHNDTNVLAMGERVIGPGLGLEIVDAWISSEFEGGRHQNRIDKIMNYERENSK